MVSTCRCGKEELGPDEGTVVITDTMEHHYQFCAALLIAGRRPEWWTVNTTLKDPATPDLINEPPHYKDHPSGVECITITEGFNYNKGNAIKYIWRAGKKGDALPDLKKARYYVEREIKRIETEWDARDRTGES